MTTKQNVTYTLDDEVDRFILRFVGVTALGFSARDFIKSQPGMMQVVKVVVAAIRVANSNASIEAEYEIDGIEQLRTALVETGIFCGRRTEFTFCDSPTGHKCPDCGLALHDVPEGA